MELRYKSQVNAVPTLASDEALAFYQAKLRYETDPADVYTDIQNDVAEFVILDVRSEADYNAKHVDGAVSLPHSRMSKKRMSEFSEDTLFVVYCWGPGCNGSTKAALKLTGLGYAVKEMIGGIEYWEQEGYPVTSS